MGRLMQALGGIISDRIRSGDIPADTVIPRRVQSDDRPTADSVRHGRGHRLGGRPGREHGSVPDESEPRGAKGGRHRDSR